MKNPLVALGSIVLCCLTIPVIISMTSYKDIKVKDKDNNVIKSLLNKKDKNTINYEKVDKESPIISIYNHNKGKVEKMDIETYLYGVLSGEMPSDFDIEALKAQAVAARTYVMYKKEQGNPSQHREAVVCTDYTHCQEYKSYEYLKENKGEEWIKNSYSKIKQAVNETKGQIITYQNKPILPLYFSTSSGKTENSEEVFSQEYTYLKSVESPYDKISPKYESTVKINNKDFVSTLKKKYSDMNLEENNLNNQVNVIKKSTGGAIEKIKIGNKVITGRDIRSVFNLNSANFQINFNKDYLNFIVKGYGHGVGMSQWGAEGMAQEGSLYYEILAHYYTDTEIEDLY